MAGAAEPPLEEGGTAANSQKAKGARGNPGGRGAAIVPSSDTRAQTPADMNVSYDQSSQWQQARLANNTDGERQCCEIRLRAERKAGQLLKEKPKAKGNFAGRDSSGGTIVEPPEDDEETLDELDMTCVFRGQP